MIKVYIPNNNIKEREYIIDVMLGEFLGLSYEIKGEGRREKGEGDWVIELENGNRLIVKDGFFNKFKKDLEYLDEKNIPKEIKFAKSQFASEDDIVVIYGDEGEREREKGEGGTHFSNTSPFTLHSSTFITNIDIFASAFFMLTRWEEYVNKERDSHNRFSAKESLAYKNNFLDRPVVNEYVEYLWNILIYLGINQKRRNREFKFIMTHDVDVPLRYFSTIKFLREIARDFTINKKYKEAFKKIKEFLLIKLKFKQDPFNTFDYMLEKESKKGIKSYYFFMGEGSNFTYDDNYDINSPFIKNLAKKILSYNNTIGIHPSYNTYNNPAQFTKEKQKIENTFGIKIECGRQHYLRFDVPTTWQIWEDNKMKWDSTLSYADKEGFRCGVCYEYNVFNFLTRQKLNLKEKPLIVMEGSFLIYQNLKSMDDIVNRVFYFIDKVKKYKGEFVFLWHNSVFVNSGYKQLYERVINGL